MVAPAKAVPLPVGWAGVSEETFAALLVETFPGGEARTFVPSAFEELSSALRSDDRVALRALAWLARCRDVLASEILLQRLERRPREQGDAGAAIDIASAAALAQVAGARNGAGRLESLAYGGRPHPDLEVRVECACSALRLGRERALRFLIQILKHGTRLEVASSGWKPIAQMEFCQRRAAEALCERAGRACRFRPLQPLDEREEDIRVLETQLAPREE
ncbi:MAG: hypothetical protein IPJ19_14140 [Planctomycetes bacterium]|nr:hypothetical protein [Planctomycetota bacterium]